MIGGSGEKRTLRAVARYADICNLFGTPDEVRHKLDVLEQHCANEGRDPAIHRLVRCPAPARLARPRSSPSAHRFECRGLSAENGEPAIGPPPGR